MEGLKEKIENLRLLLDRSIEENDNVDSIYNNSVELDKLIEEYIKDKQFLK